MDAVWSESMGAGRWSLRLLLAALLCAAGFAKPAGATITIALEWGECGGGAGGCAATGSSTIAVGYPGGQTLRLDIFLSHDLTQGLGGHSFSLNFDTGFQNELNLGPMAAVDWLGTDVHPGPQVEMYAPITAGLTSHESPGPGSAGRINSFQSLVDFFGIGYLPPNGAAYSVGTWTATAPARYRVGQAFFTVNAALTDGADVFSGLFNAVDEFFPTNTIVFGTATVNVIPEPGVSSLLGLGLVGLVLASRRRRA